MRQNADFTGIFVVSHLSHPSQKSSVDHCYPVYSMDGMDAGMPKPRCVAWMRRTAERRRAVTACCGSRCSIFLEEVGQIPVRKSKTHCKEFKCQGCVWNHRNLR